MKNFIASVVVENNKSWVRGMSLPKVIVLGEIVLGVLDETFSSCNRRE